MAGVLLDGRHHVRVCRAGQGRRGSRVARATEADTIEGAVSDVAVAVLANGEAVRQVALGDTGLRSSLEDGALYVDASTVSPSTSTELVNQFASFVAMPNVGNPDAVAARNETYLAAGTADALDKLEPVLPALGGSVRRYPDVDTGHCGQTDHQRAAWWVWRARPRR